MYIHGSNAYSTSIGINFKMPNLKLDFKDFVWKSMEAFTLLCILTNFPWILFTNAYTIKNKRKKGIDPIKDYKYIQNINTYYNSQKKKSAKWSTFPAGPLCPTPLYRFWDQFLLPFVNKCTHIQKPLKILNLLHLCKWKYSDNILL